MPVINQDVTVYRGGREVLNFTMSPVVDISGWAIEFTAAKRTTKEQQNVLTRLFTSSATKLITKSADIVSGAGGTFRVTLTADDTDIASGIYEYDIWRTDEDEELPLALGQFIVGGVVRLPESA
jgi:hypothetical protein